MGIVTEIILIIIGLIILIVDLFVVAIILGYFYDKHISNYKYARLKCEEQKKACSENFKDKKDTKYKTAVLNTSNVVKA